MQVAPVGRFERKGCRAELLDDRGPRDRAHELLRLDRVGLGTVAQVRAHRRVHRDHELGSRDELGGSHVVETEYVGGVDAEGRGKTGQRVVRLEDDHHARDGRQEQDLPRLQRQTETRIRPDDLPERDAEGAGDAAERVLRAHAVADRPVVGQRLSGDGERFDDDAVTTQVDVSIAARAVGRLRVERAGLRGQRGVQIARAVARDRHRDQQDQRVADVAIAAQRLPPRLRFPRSVPRKTAPR